MPTKRHSSELIISKRREAEEVHLSQGMTIPLMCKKLGIHQQTYFNKWRREYSGLRINHSSEARQSWAIADDFYLFFYLFVQNFS